MSYDLFVNTSIWNFSSLDRNKLCALFEMNGYTEGIDFEITDSLDMNIINYKTVNELLELVKFYKEDLK